MWRMLRADIFYGKRRINEFASLPGDFFGRQGMTTKRSGAALQEMTQCAGKRLDKGAVQCVPYAKLTRNEVNTHAIHIFGA